MAAFWPIGTEQIIHIVFLIQSEKSPDSGFFTCDPTKKCIMPSSLERHKGILGRGHDLRLSYRETVSLYLGSLVTVTGILPAATHRIWSWSCASVFREI